MSEEWATGYVAGIIVAMLAQLVPKAIAGTVEPFRRCNGCKQRLKGEPFRTVTINRTTERWHIRCQTKEEVAEIVRQFIR